jgi:hypothetical protein
MTSRPAASGAALTLLAVPLALLASAAGGDAELYVHLLLGAGFVLTSLGAFAFRTSRWLGWVGCAGIGGTGAIFLLQGTSDLLTSAALRAFAYDVLGQELERVLPDLFFVWCVAVIVQHSRDRAKLLGAATVGVVVVLEVIDYASRFTGGGLPGIAKLAYLLPFAWLLVGSTKPAADGSAPARIA